MKNFQELRTFDVSTTITVLLISILMLSLFLVEWKKIQNEENVIYRYISISFDCSSNYL